MDIKFPKVFETSDKAHADLFNDMVKVLLENDSSLFEQLVNHINDIKPHASTAEKKKWNESQLYKITADDGKQLIAVPTDGKIFDAINDKGTCTFYAPSGVEDSPAPNKAALRGIQTVGQNNIGTGFAVDTSGNAYYFYYNSSQISITWTQLPTTTEKDKWNSGQLSKITADNGMPLISIKDTSLSILDEVINNGLGQGTFYAIAGSKDLPNHRSFRGYFHMTDTTNGKASFGWVYATDYINNIYTNYLNNNVWSGWARLSNHNLLSETGQSQLLPNGTDILTLPSGYYYAVGTNVVNMPSKTDSSWFNIYVIDNGNNRKTFHLIRSGDNLHWWGTTHTDGSFRGWKRMLTDEDSISTWKQVTLVAGTSTKQFAGNPLEFSIRQNELLLRGSFEGVPANETVIARFAQNPSARTVFLGATVGSYGAARFTLEKDGSLRFDGMSANDNSYVSRFEINESIPLW
ncbi:hypothetical protein [Bacillus pumilus]|uniref:hypothetical protein n=1 Tax=Bacillus pumilus TaxID=1408 RepID=UPI0011A3EC88|nr:hypothetical protein [Bacillus pumilus]